MDSTKSPEAILKEELLDELRRYGLNAIISDVKIYRDGQTISVRWWEKTTTPEIVDHIRQVMLNYLMKQYPGWTIDINF